MAALAEHSESTLLHVRVEERGTNGFGVFHSGVREAPSGVLALI
jgi:hypothetical protein